MDSHQFILNLLIYFGAAIVAVPIAKRLGLGSVLGYLAAGAVLGPFGLKLIRNVDSIRGLAEVGVVLLLFVIGLELKLSRLWTMRKSVFGLGGSQVLLTSLPILGTCLFFGFSPAAAIIVAISLAFSSTAFALQILGERKQLSTQFGRSSFAVLLFQDLAAIPVIAVVPLLSAGQADAQGDIWIPILKTIGVFVVIVVGGRYLLRPAFKLIASTKTNELFTATALFLVLGVAIAMESIGLSMALGSFLAGVLLADSEYRHELEADIEPFKGLLLGLFFMTVGMTVDFGLISTRPGTVLALVAALVTLKVAVNYFVARRSGLLPEPSRNLAVVLGQGGEFAFVVFSAAVGNQVLPKEQANLLFVVVALSMAMTPLLVLVNETLLKKAFGTQAHTFDEIAENENPVIIVGFGRVGQVIGRTLRVLNIPFTALDKDPNQVEVLRKFGHKVYYGDASKLDLLKAAKADSAELLIVAIDDVQTSLKTVTLVREHFPGLKILARARNRQHAFELLDLGVDRIWRETFGSSIEMAESTLVELGLSASRAARTMQKFRAHDERILREQHAVFKDEMKLIDLSKRASQQLSDVLASDQEDNAEFGDKSRGANA